MKIKMMIQVFLFLIPVIFAVHLYGWQSDSAANQAAPVQTGPLNSVSFRPIDLFLSLYPIQYERRIDRQSEIILGIYSYYLKTSAYPGTYQLMSLIMGYRRYLWEGLYLEYNLLPGYAVYHPAQEQQSYNGFELWNEFHLGYKFELKVFDLPLTVSPYFLLNFNLYKANEPQSFQAVDHKPENFVPYVLMPYPNINVGISF